VEPVGGLAQVQELVVAQHDVGGRGVGLDLGDALGAGDGDHVRMVDHPGQRDLRRGGLVGGGDLAQCVQHRRGPAQVLLGEQRVSRAHAARAAVYLPDSTPWASGL
jgi:hypothetical protein